MPEPSPSALLQAAADRIRDAAKGDFGGPTPGPWGVYEGRDGESVVVADDGQTVVGQGSGIRYDDACWLEIVSPAVAESLERWMRETAKHVRLHGANPEYCWICGPALMFAADVCPELAQVRVQCSNAVHNLSLSAPERCALEEGHEGTCEP